MDAEVSEKGLPDYLCLATLIVLFGLLTSSLLLGGARSIEHRVRGGLGCLLKLSNCHVSRVHPGAELRHITTSHGEQDISDRCLFWEQCKELIVVEDISELWGEIGTDLSSFVFFQGNFKRC